MNLAPFDWVQPSSLDEAVRVLRDDPDARALAGGQSLVAAMKLGLSAPGRLVDLSRIDALHTLEPDGDGIAVGAMCTHARIAASPLVRERLPMLAALADGIGDRQIRNRGTVGGSLANHDPAACHPAGVLAAGAIVVTDRREIAADDFFQGLFATALATDELIVSVRYPALRAAAYRKFEQPASRFALLGVAVARAGDSVRVAITGGGHGVVRARTFEQALAREFSPESLDAAALDAAGMASDLHASAGYRAHLARVLAARAVADCLAGADAR